ncbi:MAG: hypothetical protein V3V11_03130 [Vicinamibacteria bacterium]
MSIESTVNLEAMIERVASTATANAQRFAPNEKIKSVARFRILAKTPCIVIPPRPGSSLADLRRMRRPPF